MSNARKTRKNKNPFRVITPWDEVLLGNQELFNKVTDPHVLLLLEVARTDIAREIRLGKLQSDWLQPEELVGETLIQAWYMRHGRSERKSIKDWLLEVQKYTLQKMIQEEKGFFDAIALSLEELVLPESTNKNEMGFDEWLESSVPERWADVIPDENSPLIAA